MSDRAAFEAILGQAKPGVRMDANETVHFELSLEHLRAQITEAEFPALKALTLVPFEPGIDEGSETFAWTYYDRVGIAKIIANYATDLPNIEEFGTKRATPIVSVGAAFGYSLTDLRRAAKTGYQLESRKARMAREAIDRVIDSIVAHGDTSTGVPGFVNHTLIPLVDTGLNFDWGNETGENILEDLMSMAFQVWTQSKQVHGNGGLRMLLGTESYKAVATKPYSATIPDTVLSVFLRSQQLVTEVESWVELDLADAQGDGERAIVYDPSPENLSAIVPIRFESLPAQAASLHFSVPCHARVGGTVVRRPLSMCYFDGLMDT